MIVMGTLYFGPYHEAIRTYEHEGYAARVMSDGTLSSTWGGDIPDDAHIGFRAACDCGWRGDEVRPADADDAYESELAIEDWRAHIQELLDAAKREWWPTWAERVRSLGAYAAAQTKKGDLRAANDGLGQLGDLIAEAVRLVDELAEAREADR